MKFTTAGMELWEREDSYNHGNIIPIETECYKAGDLVEPTTKIIVDNKNQKHISMFWNSLYFDNLEKAKTKETEIEKDYHDYLYDTFNI